MRACWVRTSRFPHRQLWRALVAGALWLPMLTQAQSPAAPKLEAELSQALEDYRQRALRTDHAGLAELFSRDGQLSHASEAPQRGREQILRFLQSFEGVQVLRYELQTLSTEPRQEGLAHQSGRWQQLVQLPDGRRIEVAGRFEIVWQRGAEGLWRIQHLHTEN